MPARISTASLFSILLASAASAAPPQEASGPLGPSEPRSEIAEEITVTAQKREDRLQDVPISVAVLTTRDLEDLDLRTSSDIGEHVTNLEIKLAFNASNATIFLRGVGLNDANTNANGTVGFYVDETYLGSPSAQVFQLFDLERVEVLRGPQGTLYGRNTTGGAINVVTKKPNGSLGGYARITAGHLDQLDFEGAFDMPLPGRLNGFRVSAVSNRRDGHTKNLYNGQDENDIDSSAARLQFRFFPRDDFSLNVKLHGGINRSGARAYQSRGLIDGGDFLGYVDTPDPFTGSYNRDTREDLDIAGLSLSLFREKPNYSLISISSYDTSKRALRGDEDASPNQLVEIDWYNDAQQFTQELRLHYNSGRRLDWIAGAYYLTENLDVENRFDTLRELRPQYGFNPAMRVFLLRQAYQQETSSLALFGQLSLRFNDRLTFRTGLRHTTEKKDITYATSLSEPLFSVPFIDFTGSVRHDAISGEIGLDYRLSSDSLFFASARRGFKSGGFSGGALFSNEQLVPVKPEFLHSLEAGSKSLWLDGRLRLNATAFYYSYQDLQVFNFVTTGGLSIQRLDNASNAEVKGLECDLTVQAKPSLQLKLDFAYLDAKYKDFVLSNGSDFSGNRLVAAPRTSSRATARYSWETAKRSWTADLALNQRGKIFLDPRNIPRIAAGNRTLLNGRLTVKSPAGRYTFSAWGKNITNEHYLVDVLDASDFGFDQLVIGDPRTYGVELSVHL